MWGLEVTGGLRSCSYLCKKSLTVYLKDLLGIEPLTVRRLSGLYCYSFMAMAIVNVLSLFLECERSEG